jgi:hypothetical protein
MVQTECGKTITSHRKGERTMAILIRRLTIITLLMAIFAMSFAALAINPHRNFQRMQLGTITPCSQSIQTNCTTIL